LTYGYGSDFYDEAMADHLVSKHVNFTVMEVRDALRWFPECLVRN